MGSPNFQYKRPRGKRYLLDIRDYNKAFCTRGRYPFTTVEVYVAEDQADLHFRPSLFGKTLLMVLSPLFYVIMTVQHGYKETHTAFKEVLYDKQRGSYSTERIYRKNVENWAWLMKNLK